MRRATNRRGFRMRATRSGFTSSAAAAASILWLSTTSPALAQAPVAQSPEDEEAERGRPSDQAVVVDPDTIVVTGTAFPVEREQIGNSNTLIDGEEIEIKKSAYLQDVLREVPGLAVNRGGSFGALSQVRIRGADGNHVLFLIDGIEVAPTGGEDFDVSSLLANNIERIEVLRGPQSGLYGSNALAGVINVITRGGDGPLLDAAVEYGTFDSRLARAGVTVGDRETFVSASGIYRETDGFSSAAIGTEDDGDRNITGYLRGGARVSDAVRVDGSLRFVDKDTESDGFDFSGGPNQGLAVDGTDFSDTQDWSGGAALTVTPVERWRTLLAVALTDTESVGGAGGTATFGNEGDRMKFAGRTTYRIDAGETRHAITLFAEHEEEGYRNTFPSDPSQDVRLERDLFGYGAEYRLDLFDSIFLRGAIRHDDNDAFRDPTTFSVAGSWVIRSSGTRFHASYGTGVTNPTFFEQFGFVPGTFVGNPDLLPERAEGWDIGVEQRLLDSMAVVDVTYFNSTLEDEIVGAFPSVANQAGESHREGIELSGRIDLGWIDFGGHYTHLDADDPDGTPEIRRPRSQAAFDVAGRFGPESRGGFSAGVIYNGRMLDNDFRDYFANGFVSEKSPLESYTVARLSVLYSIGDEIELFGRLENAFDEDYREVISYATPGRAVYGGVRVVLP